jgi:hypothetical protein
MRIRLVHVLVLVLGGGVTLSLIHGQTPPEPPPVPTPAPVGRPAPVPPATQPAAPVKVPQRDTSKYTPLQLQMYLSAQRAADWLYRMNGVKGRFLYGFEPTLRLPIDGDSSARQIAAAMALAHAARFTGEERYAVRATQAILALLDETILSPDDPQVRHPALPSSVINRLGTAGLLVAAIHALPAPQTDLLEKSEQLCNYIRRQVREDGTLRCDDADKKDADTVEAISTYPPQALLGLVRSQKLRPAAWKLKVARKAMAAYRPWWRDHKNLTFVPTATTVCVEAYMLGKDALLAEFVGEMNDWLCGLQYDQIEARRELWFGGFMNYADGHKVESAPDIGSAPLARSLAAASRLARTAGDIDRHQRYTDTLERALQFVTTLQYSDASTQHFAHWYRARLVGAFHPSHADGNLRIDYTEQALTAMLGYLEDVEK